MSDTQNTLFLAMCRIVKTSISAVVQADGRAFVPVVNCPPGVDAEVLEVLCQRQRFAVSWYVDGPSSTVNLVFRSDINGDDVSRHAESFGGDGDKHEASAALPLEQLGEAMQRLGLVYV